MFYENYLQTLGTNFEMLLVSVFVNILIAEEFTRCERHLKLNLTNSQAIGEGKDLCFIKLGDLGSPV